MVSTQSEWNQSPTNVSSTVLEPRACLTYLACLSKPFVLVFNPGHGEIELLLHLCWVTTSLAKWKAPSYKWHRSGVSLQWALQDQSCWIPASVLAKGRRWMEGMWAKTVFINFVLFSLPLQLPICDGYWPELAWQMMMVKIHLHPTTTALYMVGIMGLYDG